MSKIHKACLVHFNPKHNEHLEALRKNKYFELFSNTDLFTEMLERTNFDLTDAEAEDYNQYIIEGKIYIGLDTTELSVDNDDNHYLFDAFNVYYASNNFAYYQLHKGLTNAWRKTLVDAYSNTTYPTDLKKVLKRELKEIVDKFKKDNSNLL